MKHIRPTTRQAIIEAAFEQLNQNPKASLADIAQLAGVGRATLHRQFKGREELIHTMALQALEETEQAANSASHNSRSYTEAFEHIFQAMIPLGARHWFLAAESLSQHADIQQLLKQQDQDMDQLIDQVKKEGLLSVQFPNQWIIQTFDHLIHAAWTLIKEQQATTKQATEWAWQTLLGGLQVGGKP